MIVDNENKLQLGELISRGGQGSVYRIANRDDRVVKLYHEEKQPSPIELQRLDRLIAASKPILLDCCAWPLSRTNIDGRVAVIMRCIDESHELHMLIDRSSRVSHFRHADWKFMVQAAQHLAQACSQVHAAGMLLVDISEKNVLVNRSAEINLIDCDGFVFQGGGQFGSSNTFTLQWTAPELRGQTLSCTERTINHDNYALARAIFKLLFQGSEPMQALDGDGDAPGEQVFVFSRRRPVRSQAPFELTLDQVPQEIADLFEQAFDSCSASPGVRPTAAQWATALTKMLASMHRCTQQASHSYVQGLSSGCPWCARAAIQADYDDFRDESVPGKLDALPPKRRWRFWMGGAALFIGILTIAAYLILDVYREDYLRWRGKSFIVNHFDLINNPRSNWGALESHYSPNVSFYKNSQPEKFFQYFFDKWPNRVYKIVADSLNVSCNEMTDECSAVVLVRFQVDDGKGKNNAGCWRYIYKINIARTKTLILYEDGDHCIKGVK
jgi:serine/threonine protein kinase